MKYFVAIFILTLMILPTSSFADVPPDPGYKSVSIKLIVTLADDLKDYRFFLKSGADVKEIELKKGESATIGPIGGGAYYRGGVFVAVPVTSLTTLSDDHKEGEKLSQMKQAIYDGKVAGMIELVKHSFVREVPERDAANVKDAEYRIERTKDGLHAAPIGAVSDTNTNGNGGRVFGITEIKKNISPFGLATVVGGILMSIALAMLGIIFFWKRTRRA